MPVVPRIPRVLLIPVIASVIAAAAVVPGSTRPVAARSGSTFISIANEYRAEAGVRGVSFHTALNQIAIERANKMARTERLEHDMDYVRTRMAQEGVCWESFAEIIAYNGRPEDERVPRFFYQWYHSDTHREILLGPGYTHAGGSYTTASNGYHYAAMIFVRLCEADRQVAPATPFTDIASNKFERAITWVYRNGIMDGCRATRFCPGAYLTRGQLAGALASGLGLPSTSRDFYADDDGTRYEDAINRLAAAGLTHGCGSGNYCPNRVIRRGSLATAIAVALELSPTNRDYFRDDETSRHEDAINRIAAAGITSGCGTGKYCPDGRVRRDQATAFLRNAFD